VNYTPVGYLAALQLTSGDGPSRVTEPP
jgi:hypothetical protein